MTPINLTELERLARSKSLPPWHSIDKEWLRLVTPETLLAMIEAIRKGKEYKDAMQRTGEKTLFREAFDTALSAFSFPKES